MKAWRIFALLAAMHPVAAAEAQGWLSRTQHPVAPDLFRTADVCVACHNGIVTPSGEDVSIGLDWRASMMANSARDPYWQAAVRREVMDHPEAGAEIEAECSICHMPMARTQAHLSGGRGEVFANLPIGRSASPFADLAADGVSCTVCHQILEDGLGEPESFTGGFRIDPLGGPGERRIFGPFEVDTGRTTIMHSASRFLPTQATHLQSSALCGSCHTLYTHSLGPGGEVIDTFPEQMPYVEWLHSAYPAEGRSCQSCHMPVVAGEVPITSVLPQPREEVSRHVFRGGNFFMLGMLARYRDELGVKALPHELALTARRTVEHLQTRAATLSVSGVEVRDGRLSAEVRVENLGGHKLPTAYPSRRAWIHLRVWDGAGAVVFESGALSPLGWIAGNDNDDDPGRYEPHHREITRGDQVQIYETILGAPDGGVTTGLLTAVRYLKDNRVLPRGFDKASASDDIAVRGEALGDADFSAGEDRVRYVADVAGTRGPYRVEAELWYQPIAYRWAHNLRSYDAFETSRFVSYYDSMAHASAVVLARAAAASP